MSSPPIDRTCSIADVAAANAALQATEDEIAAARKRKAEQQERCLPLQVQIAEVEAQPSAVDGPDPAQVDALLGDPAARIDANAIAEQVSAARREDDVRRHTVAVIKAAIGRVEAQIAEIEAEIAKLERRRDEQWEAFAIISRHYLAEEFRAAFVELRDRVMIPLDALVEARGRNGRNFASAGAAKIDQRTEVKITRYDGGSYDDETLYPLRGHKALPWPDVIAAFRASLISPASSSEVIEAA